jgi:hypothetical protein
VERLRRKYGLGSRPKRPEQSWQSPQMQLALENGEK